MAQTVFTNGFCSVAANDISSSVRAMTLNYSADTQEVTAMGDDTQINLGGLKNWSLEVELNQDFASSALDSILFPLLGTSVAIEIRPDAGAVSTSNPKFTGSGIITDYPPLGGSVGDAETTKITIVSAASLVRATA